MPPERLGAYYEVIGALAAEDGVSMYTTTPEIEIGEIDAPTDTYNPQLVSYLSADVSVGSLTQTQRVTIPVLPTHKLEAFAELIGDELRHLQISSEFQERIKELDRIKRRTFKGRVGAEPRYTFAEILRADRLIELVRDIRNPGNDFTFSELQIRFLEKCAVSLHLEK